MTIAITGGIGSGKTYVCQRLQRRGIAVYDCDAAAKRLIREDASIQARLDALVGGGLFAGGTFHKRLLSEYLLASQDNARQVNAIVHPAVASDFLASGYSWIETALLFVDHFHTRLPIDHIICVTAPVATRLRRVMARDHLSADQASAWIAAQQEESYLVAHSDIILHNDDNDDIDQQIERILQEITTE